MLMIFLELVKYINGNSYSIDHMLPSTSVLQLYRCFRNSYSKVYIDVDDIYIYMCITPWLFNIAMENKPFIDEL